MLSSSSLPRRRFAAALLAPPARLRPPLARVTRKLAGGPRLEDLAEIRRELQPASPRRLPEALSLPGEFERVKGFDDTTNRADQERWLLGPVDENGPTRAWLLRDMLMTPAGIFHARGFAPLRPRAPWQAVRGALPDWQDLVRAGGGGEAGRGGAPMLCTDQYIEIYFGHWLRDALQLELLAGDQGLAPVVLPPRPWLHEEGYRRMAGMPLPMPPGLAESGGQVRFGALWVCDDRGLNAGRIERARRLRDRILAATPPGGPELVFVRRGKSGASRLLVNEAEIEARLTARGFTVLEPETSSPEEIAHAMAGARIVVAVEGSAVTHSQACLPEGAAVVVIQPPYRFNALARVFNTALGHHYAYTVADPAEGGFHQPADRLLATLDLVAARQAAVSL